MPADVEYVVLKTAQRRMGEESLSENAWTQDILRRIDVLIGEEDEDVEDVMPRHGRHGQSNRSGDEPAPMVDSSLPTPLKNTIPSDTPSSCARSLEVWLQSPELVYNRIIADAYEHVSNTCRGTTDLVVFRGTIWNQKLWTSSWESRFSDLRSLARSRASMGEDVKTNGVLGNLHVALKLYGKRHPVVRLMP